jgi:hypothetical protein
MRSVFAAGDQGSAREGEGQEGDARPFLHDHGCGFVRDDLRSRSISDRQDVALHAGDLHQGLRRDQEPLRAVAGLSRARLHERAVLLQHRRRSLRSVQRARA